MKPEKYDFGGWATRHNTQCSDGRTILPDAFAANDGMTVPLMYRHGIKDPANILGHAYLENRPEGVYAYCTFNDSGNANNVKGLIKHKALNALSVYANGLVQVGNKVKSGIIREVSTVLQGANPGALIDTFSFSHDGLLEDSEIDEAYIQSGFEIEHEESAEDAAAAQAVAEAAAAAAAATLEHDGKTVEEILSTLNPEQKAAVGFLLDNALNGEGTPGSSAQHEDDLEGESMNIFDRNANEGHGASKHLTHDDFVAVWDEAQKCGSFKQAFMKHMEDNGFELQHAEAPETNGTAGVDYGVTNLDILFPDARALNNLPDFIKRDTSWVSVWMGGTRHVPFSRIKTRTADITPDEARAKGYVKGTRKTEEVFGVMQRTTSPTTIYKKQKLDRDDILDVTDFDIVMWVKAEMRLMLDEEVARAGLLGDGRLVSDPDKIKDPAGSTQDGTGIRSVYNDDEFYAHRVALVGDTALEQIDEIVKARKYYKGSGNPVMFTTEDYLADLLLVRDAMDRRMYRTVDELASELRVSQIVTVEVMEDQQHEDASGNAWDLKAIMINPNDYTYGADKGGDINSFEDFDIDFNQEKYLLECRSSGAITKYKSALIFETAAAVPPVG